MQWVPAGQEANFLAALAQIEDFSFFDLHGFLDRMPTSWQRRMSVPPAVDTLVRRVCRRDRHQIPLSSRWWSEGKSLISLAKKTGIDEGQLACEALQGIAEEERLGSAADLFYMASLAAHASSPDDAASALRFALDEMDSALDVDDGDGSWRDELMPSGTLVEVIADYLWSMMGSPEVKRRWRAAHAVRCLVRWAPECVLQRLCQDALRGKIAAMQDHRLPFYQLHAEEWLLVALARVAIDAPVCLGASAEFLTHKARPQEKHARLRSLAANTLVRLHEGGIFSQTLNEFERLKAINADRSSVLAPRPVETKAVGDEGGRLFFHYESRDSLLRPLSSAFKISEDDANKRLEPIMRMLATDEIGNLVSTDPRRERGIIRNDDRRGRHARHQDDWSSYLSGHAVMTLCGQLLDGDTPGKGDEGYFSPAHFLKRQGLSSPAGGRWAADRRSAVPSSCRLIATTPDKDWLAQINQVDPEALVDLADDLCIWGRWTGAERFSSKIRVGYERTGLTRNGTGAIAGARVSRRSPRSPAAGYKRSIRDWLSRLCPSGLGRGP